MAISTCLIYGLVDPETDELKYIGRSSSGLRRPRSHWELPASLTRRDKVHRWCKSLIDRGLVPQIVVLEFLEKTLDVSSRLDDAERFWIASIRATGAELKNITDGGDSIPDTRGPKNGMFGKVHPSKGKKLDLTPEQRERRAVNHGKSPSQETRDKIARHGSAHHMFGRKHSEETLQRMRKPHRTYRGKPVSR